MIDRLEALWDWIISESLVTTHTVLFCIAVSYGIRHHFFPDMHIIIMLCLAAVIYGFLEIVMLTPLWLLFLATYMVIDGLIITFALNYTPFLMERYSQYYMPLLDFIEIFNKTMEPDIPRIAVTVVVFLLTLVPLGFIYVYQFDEKFLVLKSVPEPAPSSRITPSQLKKMLKKMGQERK